MTQGTGKGCPIGYRVYRNADLQPGLLRSGFGKRHMPPMADPLRFGYFTVALAAAAAVAFASGVQFVVVGLRQQRQAMYLSYATLCFCIAVMAIANAFVDVASTSSQLILGTRLVCAAAAIAFPALVMFVGAYTGKPLGREMFAVVCAVSLWFFSLNFVLPYGMVDSSLKLGAPKVLPWGETIAGLDGARSIWGSTFYWLTYLVFSWSLYRAWYQYRHHDRRAGLWLGLCLLVQFTALLWGAVLIDSKGYPYPHVDVFAFLSFVLLMGLSLARQLQRHARELERNADELRDEIETRRQAEFNLRHAAFHDALTGLPNLQHALVILAELLSDAARTGHVGAVLLIDLDNFKTINDSLGHHVGDRVLQVIAGNLLDAAPAGSTVARLGGDEFVVLLQRLSSDEESAADVAVTFAEALLAQLASPLTIDSRTLGMGASIGVALFSNRDETATDILRCADIAMYRAKAGRNAARLFQPQMQHDADRRLELERGLRGALESNELSLNFQPHVSMDGTLVGAEVLLRWHHPMLGDVSPATFIPIAEETGLIHAIGAWVMAQACTHIRNWREAGVAFGGRLAVNVSPWQIAHPQFVQRIEAQVKSAGIDPQWLTLELTESALLNDFSRALVTLQELSDIGFRLALDDFGTGYSSLAYLQQLPLDELKIDQTFISALQPSSVDPLVGFIIDIGRRLGMTTIAEGVETAQQKDTLERLGCDVLQGYLICRPLNEADFLAWLALQATLAIPVPAPRLGEALPEE